MIVFLMLNVRLKTCLDYYTILSVARFEQTVSQHSFSASAFCVRDAEIIVKQHSLQGYILFVQLQYFVI